MSEGEKSYLLETGASNPLAIIMRIQENLFFNMNFTCLPVNDILNIIFVIQILNMTKNNLQHILVNKQLI